MASLFMTVGDALTPSLRGLIVEALGEPPEGVDRAVRCLLGGVVTGLISVAGAPSGAADVLEAVRRMDVGVLFDASPLLDTDWRERTSPGLLGVRVAPLAAGAAADTGISPESARALLHVVEPLVLAAIARSGVASDESGLRSFLRSLEPEATRLAPAPRSGAETKADPVPDPAARLLEPLASAAQTRSPAARRNWLLIVLALIALALALLFTIGRD